MKNKRISIKYRLLAAAFVILLPITILFNIFVSRAVKQLNSQLAEANKSTLRGYCTAIQGEVQDMDAFLNLLWGENEAFDNASVGEDMDRAVRELAAVFAETAENNQTASYLALYTPEKGLLCPVYSKNAEYDSSQQSAITEMVLSLMPENGFARLGWFVEGTGQNSFLARVVQKGEVSAVCLLDIQNIAKRSQSDFALASPVVLADKGKPLTTAVWLQRTWGDRVPAVEDYSFAGRERQYMVVSQAFLGMTAFYGVPYRSNMGVLGWLRLGPVLFLSVTMLVLAAAWLYMKYSFFRPLGELVKTMERIQANDLQSRTGRYTSKEFAQVNETFNSMISTITGLKIESYEQRLAAQRAEMSALRMQIHPHFYLNCLKNIYGLAQSGCFEEIQSMILLLSNHLRYTFDLNSDVVPMSRELQMCENYIRLQAVTRAQKPRCQLNVDPELLDLRVPPVSLLTLVENCVKHGTAQDRPLAVTITACRIPMEDGALADIIVEDNGPGFSAGMVEKLNKNQEMDSEESHVGLANVVQRFRLLYGEDFAVSYWNKDGACVEIMIHYKETKEEKKDEAVDCG